MQKLTAKSLVLDWSGYNQAFLSYGWCVDYLHIFLKKVCFQGRFQPDGIYSARVKP